MSDETRISVLHFSNEFSRGGAEAHILTLLRGLDRRHFRPCLACTPQMASALQSEIPMDVEVFPVSLRKPTQIAEAHRLARILRRNRIDILHSHMFFASANASPIGWLCRVPLIFETPHVREQWRQGWLKSSYFIDRCVSKVVDEYIAVSKSNARYLMEEKRLPPRKVVTIRNGCDLDQFGAGRPVPIGLKRSLGFGESDPVMAVIGRLEPQKGHALLLEVLPSILSEFPTLRLVCVGEGSLRSELAKMVDQGGLKDSVRFVGFQSNIADWLALADFTVLPSLYEGLPLAAIESLAAERPVIASAVDGTPEVVINGMTGLTFQAGDVSGLAKAILRLARYPELVVTMGQAGRRWVLTEFSDKRQVRKTEALYLYAWNQRQLQLGLRPKDITLWADIADFRTRLVC